MYFSRMILQKLAEFSRKAEEIIHHLSADGLMI
jgi:hypothetical protein